ncbi:MAG: hypothetical protein IBJ13_03200 [Sphingopyxis sp.]|nr:hypothetical protein [Sphingopyxis sp.]
MHDWVAEWRQEGQIFVWRYPKNSKHAGEWHFTGDPAGCRSFRNLIDRMAGGEACHRTWTLGRMTDAIWAVPNYGEPRHDGFTSMRIVFDPDKRDLTMEVTEARLVMSVGNAQLRHLRAAFSDIEVGRGDFGIGTSDGRKPDIWMFWPMPWSAGFHR